jgi:YVTN family beta-propeller protein
MEQKHDSGQRLAFGEFVLDLQEAALTCRGQAILLSAKEFELLWLLVSHAGHLIHKETIIRHVWPDTFVSDSSLLRTISVLRKHLGRDAIRTFPKRGYAFSQPVAELDSSRRTSIPPGETAKERLEDREPDESYPRPNLADTQGSELSAAADLLPTVRVSRGSWRLQRGVALGVAVIAIAMGVTAAIEFRWRHNWWHHSPAINSAVSPEQAAVAARLVVLNQHENSVSILDTVSETVASTVPLLADPRGVAILPDSSCVYISLNGANRVAVLDTRSNRVLATIPVGKNPVGLVANPRPPFVYVANNYSNTVSVIDSRTRAVVRTLTVGSVPTEIAVSGDGTRAIVTNQSGGSVTILDAVANAVLATVAVGSTPVGVAFTPDSKFAWVTLAGENDVAVIDVASEQVVRRIPVGTSPIRVLISRDGRQALISNFLSNTLTVVDTASLKATAKILVGLNPVGVAFDPAGKFAYAANYGSNTVSMIDTSTMKVLRTVHVGANPVELAVLPCYAIPCAASQQEQSASLR